MNRYFVLFNSPRLGGEVILGKPAGCTYLVARIIQFYLGVLDRLGATELRQVKTNAP